MAGLRARLLAEGLGTSLLLAIVVGSGVMAQRLAGGNLAVALLANTIATVAGLFVLIELFGPVSGAHFNPVVSCVMGLRGELSWARVVPYVGAQLAGAVAGTGLAHAMFGLSVVQWSTHVRAGPGLLLAEVVATFGLVLVVLRAPPQRASAMVAAWIGAAYWFTSSTSFANPAAVLGRMISDTFAGIAPRSAPAFAIAECAGAALALLVHRALNPEPCSAAPRADASIRHV